MYYFFLFYMGACLASFAYCFAGDWVRQDISWTRRSACDHCQHDLAWYDLLPIFSQLFCRFRCTYCHKPFSPSYLCLEVLGGLILLLTSFIFPQMSLVYIGLFSLVLMLMVFCDILALWVPDLLQAGLGILSVYYIVENFYPVSHLWHALLLLSILAVLVYLKREALGGADIKLLAILSVLLPLEALGLFLFLASFFALAYVLMFKSKTAKIPFVPFIVMAFYCLKLFG